MRRSGASLGQKSRLHAKFRWKSTEKAVRKRFQLTSSVELLRRKLCPTCDVSCSPRSIPPVRCPASPIEQVKSTSQLFCVHSKLCRFNLIEFDNDYSPMTGVNWKAWNISENTLSMSNGVGEPTGSGGTQLSELIKAVFDQASTGISRQVSCVLRWPGLEKGECLQTVRQHSSTTRD